MTSLEITAVTVSLNKFPRQIRIWDMPSIPLAGNASKFSPL